MTYTIILLCYAAYLYYGSNHQSTLCLLPDKGEDFSYFGASVAVTVPSGGGVSWHAGGTVLVGAYGHYFEGGISNSG
jgi:hypothetical protein